MGHAHGKRQIRERGDGYGKGTLRIHPPGKRNNPDGYGTINYNGQPGKRKVPDVYGKGQAHAHGKRKIPDGYGNGSEHAHGKSQI